MMTTEHVAIDRSSSQLGRAEILTKATVAVVALDSTTAAMVESVVGLYGTDVIRLRSAREYLTWKREPTNTCLLVDLELPDMSGLDLQLWLGIAAPPIIFMGQSGDIRAAIRAMKAGAHEFLIKPLEPAHVFAAIHTALKCDSLRRNEWTRLAILKSRLEGLSPRERQVLPMLLAGLRNKQAASHLGISEVTVQIHRGQIMRKMRARSFAELVKMGQALGVGSPALAGGNHCDHCLPPSCYVTPAWEDRAPCTRELNWSAS
jgi:FixJ family two-component response regulator